MHEIKLGKNLIETLTTAMYEDARFIFREYIQNAADQIDKAVEAGILKNSNEGRIHITIDSKNKRIVVEDNGTGIKSDKVGPFLGNIALSEKDREKNKGFRGIGRLGGLGYCHEVIYETSFYGEKIKSIMTWDAAGLQRKLDDQKLDLDAASLVSSVIKIDYENAEEDEHYFKVRLENVTKKDLLDRKNIGNYLSMTAPLPFPNRFFFKKKINDELQKDGLSIDEYIVYLDTDQLFKAYTTSLYEGTENSKKKIDDVFDIEFIKIFKEKELLAWGWYGVSKFEKQIPARSNPSRGLRLRKGNIQIGSENALNKLHKEQRSNFYFIGEVHGVHPGLIPNARRDYFKENEIAKTFEKELSALFHTKFYKLYHDANRIKNACKKVVKPREIEKDYKEKTKNGFSTKEERELLDENLLKCKVEATKARKELDRIKERCKTDEVLAKIYVRILDNYQVNTEDKNIRAPGSSKIFYRTDKLSKLAKNERKLLSKVFSVIDQVLTPDLAENLKQKIEEEFK